MDTLTSPILVGEKLSDEHQQRVLDEFYREGLAMLPGVLTPGEIEALRHITDYCIDEASDESLVVQRNQELAILRYTQSIHRLFCDMLVREPFLSLAEAILGPDCCFVGQNVIRNGQDSGISHWHVDDFLEFPLPPAIRRHDARVQMPVFWFSFQIALSDIETPAHGPTEVVLGSHYSGRSPDRDGQDMAFEGRGVTPILCKAGDIYVFNHQLWHRGSVNSTNRPRYLMQNQYGKAWGRGRFALVDNNCTLADEELAGASPRLLRMLRRD